MIQDPFAEVGQEISRTSYDFSGIGGLIEDEDLVEGDEEASQQRSGFGAMDQSLRAEEGEDVSEEERQLLDGTDGQTRAAGSASKIRACAVIFSAAMMIACAALLPSGTMGLKEVSSVNQVVEKMSLSDLKEEHPLSLFDCIDGACCDVDVDDLGASSTEECAAKCLENSGCIGFQYLYSVISSSGMCFVLFESDDDGCFIFENVYSFVGSSMETCKRVHTTVTGEWVALTIVQSPVDHKVKSGTEKMKSSSWERSVSAEMEAGFSGAFTQAESEEFTRTKETTIVHHLKPDFGGQAWQWRFRVERDSSTDFLRTDNVMQTKDRGHPPLCLPGRNKDEQYQQCYDDGYL